MALVGTISGSNGTSTTAISGSLIIADEPGSRFPVLASGVKLFVSGNKTDLGSDTPNSIFGGDAFVSGAFGTDSYIQMKPVGQLRIPTNTTASYIYTSGSTNDMYFSQYQPGTGYTNTTRLRWLESSVQSGLLHGGVLSSASGSTTYSVTAGSGLIVTQNATLLEDPYPTIRYVSWDAIVSSSLPSISTTQITYIALDSTGTPFLQSTPFVDGDYYDYIVLGRVLHTDKLGTNGAVVQPAICYGANQFRGDFVRAFGPIKISGHTFYTNGTQGLRKDAGDSYVEGRNYTVDPSSPNYIASTSDTAQNTSKIFYEYVDTAGDDVIINNGNLGYAVLDFANYNNAGTLTSVGAGNKFTIQRVFWFPNGVNRAFFVYYGNTIYSTIADAQAGISTEVFTEGKNTRDAAIFLGYVIVKGTGLDFADPTTYKVIQAGSFRAVASSGAGATGSPGGSDTLVQFNDAGVFNGTNDFKFAKITGTVSMANLIVSGTTVGSLVSSGTFQVKNSGGVVVGSISTGGVISGSSDLQIGGNLTGSNLRLSGDVEIVGGDVISSATIFNFIPSGSTGNTLNMGETTGVVQIGKATGPTTVRLAYGNTTSPSVKTVEIGVNGQAGSTTNIAMGSVAGSGRITLNNDVALVTGNIIGAPGAGANVMTLVSSGNIIARLDTDNSAPGHRFEVHDHLSAVQFSVNENGNTDVAGVLVVSGTSLGTSVTTTFNLLNSTLTGTLNIGGAATQTNFGNPTSTGSFNGDLGVGGRTTLGGVVERMSNFNGSTGTVNFDMIGQSIFYVNGPTGNITANFTNVPTANNRVHTPTVVLSQSATPHTISSVTINGGGAETINWSGGGAPTSVANKQDVFGFTLIRSGSIWKVLGQMTSFG